MVISRLLVIQKICRKSAGENVTLVTELMLTDVFFEKFSFIISIGGMEKGKVFCLYSGGFIIVLVTTILCGIFVFSIREEHFKRRIIQKTCLYTDDVPSRFVGWYFVDNTM